MSLYFASEGFFVKSQMGPMRYFVHHHHRKHSVGRKMCCHSPQYLFFSIKGETLARSDANLALSALLHCNSFQPVFCLTQHISCKWIFKDLHIYITGFLSLNFSKSAKFCPKYANFLLVSHSGDHSDGEHVCCWLRSQTLKHFFSVSRGSPTNVLFCGEFHFINICNIPSVFLYFRLKACLKGERCQRALFDKFDLYSHYLGCSSAGAMI